MLDKVWALLEIWEKEGVENALLTQPTLPTPDELTPELSTLSADDRRAFLTRLHDFTAAIEAYQAELVKNMQATDLELRKLSNTRNACLSYNTRQSD